MKAKIAVLSIFIFFLSCKKDVSVTNLNGNKIGCFGHAGMGSRSVYPPNTLESFKTCLDRGADGTEMDLQVTKDGVLVIFHDNDLSSVTECGGVIRDLNWGEIDACRVNSPVFKHLNVISFDEFIQKIKNPHHYMFTFDCKLTSGSGDDGEYYKRFATSIAETAVRHGLQRNIFVENTDPDFLNAVKDLNKDLRLFLLGEDYESDMKAVMQNGFYGLSIANSNISAEQIADAHSKNVRITVYGVETNRQNYTAVEKQPDFIQTDDLNYLLRMFGKFNLKKKYFSSLFKSIG
jgi:glycerophosphoryl diester phosphodiesterase